MKEYNSIALILMLGGMAVLLYSLQSSLIGSAQETEFLNGFRWEERVLESL
jgi:hypothetical protein